MYSFPLKMYLFKYIWISWDIQEYIDVIEIWEWDYN